jgi:type II secretion system protein N
MGFWHIAVSDALIMSFFNTALNEKGLHADMSGMRKGFFFNFEAGRLTIDRSGVALITIENVRGKIDPFSPFVFRLTFLLSGDVGGGSINTRLDLLRNKKLLSITIDKSEIENIPLLSTMGLTGTGIFSGDLRAENDFGEIKFNIDNVDIKTASFGGIPVPLEMFSGIKGLLSLSGNTTEIKSLTLEGEGIYARVQGNISAGRINLDLELMPEASFKERNPVFSLLEQYKISPGYYSVPIISNLFF